MENGTSYFSCPRCGLIWLDEKNRLSREQEARHYATHENHGPAYLDYLRKTAEPVLARVSGGSLCLDYGCGPTEGMRELISPMGFSVESYDPFFFPRVLLKNHYDFVLCSEAAEHFFCPAEEFARIDATLKPGGLLGVRSQLWEGKESFRDWYYRRDPTHVCFYTEKSVRWLAGHFGWELLELRSPLWVLRKP